MPVQIIQGTNDKPMASETLARFFGERDGWNGVLYLGYPIIGTSDGRFAIDAIWLSPDKGLIVFDMVEGLDSEGFEDRQDESANFLEAKLRTHRELIQRRDLLVPISTLSYGSAFTQNLDGEYGYQLVCEDGLADALNDIAEWDGQQEQIFDKALSAIQSISNIRKSRTRRSITRPDSRGAKLKSLEGSIATLDSRQSKAVIETVYGVQRIRGLAGSGKTIVLALKAAYLHSQHPDWQIAVTFNTRSLKGQFKRLINTFCIEQAGEEPDWDKIKVLNAWGAPGDESRNGVYYEFCVENGLKYYDFGSAKDRFGKGEEFLSVCRSALAETGNSKHKYDVILVDEAQDFPPDFLKLCYEFLSKEKRLVYAYDELQSLAGEALPAPEKIFGVDEEGKPLVSFGLENDSRGDILLSKCYRNSRPVLATAHAFGFGIYREPTNNNEIGLVQMFDHASLWEDVGYVVSDGQLAEGEEVTLTRTKETSPLFLEKHSSLDDLVQFHSFSDKDSQMRWVLENIKKNLNEDELRAEDIVVINTNPFTTRENVGSIRNALFAEGINSHLAGVDTDPDVFFKSGTGDESVTFTGIFRAKGNEAGMVYIINAEDCHSDQFNLETLRNRLFTAITRSKAWVRVLGVGSGMDQLVKEFEALKANNFELKFTYPTEGQRGKLRVVHRDMSKTSMMKVSNSEQSLGTILAQLENGELNLEDLNPDIVAKLKRTLEGNL